MRSLLLLGPATATHQPAPFALR